MAQEKIEGRINYSQYREGQILGAIFEDGWKIGEYFGRRAFSRQILSFYSRRVLGIPKIK